jgi:Flp pilus assembly protein TadB
LRGLLLLLPVLSCALAFVAYLLGASLWVILAAFFIAGPLVILLFGLLLGGRANDKSDDLPDRTRN